MKGRREEEEEEENKVMFGKRLRWRGTYPLLLLYLAMHFCEKKKRDREGDGAPIFNKYTKRVLQSEKIEERQ